MKIWKEKIRNNIHVIDSNVADRFLIGKSMNSKTVQFLKKRFSNLKKKYY